MRPERRHTMTMPKSLQKNRRLHWRMKLLNSATITRCDKKQIPTPPNSGGGLFIFHALVDIFVANCTKFRHRHVFGIKNLGHGRKRWESTAPI